MMGAFAILLVVAAFAIVRRWVCLEFVIGVLRLFDGGCFCNFCVSAIVVVVGGVFAIVRR